MNMNIILPLILALFGLSYGEVNPKEVRCIVCKTTIEEMTKAIDKVNPKKKIQVGGFRIGEDGSLQEKLIPYARSRMHLSELMDVVCKNMEKYVRARSKETGKLMLIKLMSDDGNMNPEISNVDLIQDSDLNKSLEFYCEGIVEEFEPEIVMHLEKPSENPVDSICSQATNLCNFDKDEL